MSQPACHTCLWHGDCDAEDCVKQQTPEDCKTCLAESQGDLFCCPSRILVGYVPLPPTIEEMRKLIGGVE